MSSEIEKGESAVSKSMQKFQIPGAPDFELRRSPAASIIGELASSSGLLMAHYEYRVALEPPEEWMPPDRPDLGERPVWNGGVLPEGKYQNFRTDLMIGSFNPGHRAKWTAHELCHALVGFAWQKNASPFFHATAARLAELLPVAIYYFFDEAGLARCPDHTHSGPLFKTYCANCEMMAAKGPWEDDPLISRRLQEGVQFIERELEAVHLSIKKGRPISSPWGSLDLCSDGMAYAAAHGRRLSSEQFATFIQKFYPPGTGCHQTLESLEGRIRELTAAILGESEAEPWPVPRWAWICRDLGWRLLELSAQVDGPLVQELNILIDDLAANPSDTAVSRVLQAYDRLFEEYELPEPGEIFAVGYMLPNGGGLSRDHISEGIASACPLTWDVLDLKAHPEVVDAFMTADRCERKPLGERFANWLSQSHPGFPADLARFEATVTHAPLPDMACLSLGPVGVGGYRVNPGIQFLETTWKVMAHLDMMADEGEKDHPPHLIIKRNANGETQIIHPEPEVAAYLKALQTGKEPPHLDKVQELAELGIIAPVSWGLSLLDGS